MNARRVCNLVHSTKDYSFIKDFFSHLLRKFFAKKNHSLAMLKFESKKNCFSKVKLN